MTTIPSQYSALISKAAQQTGLPESVVAAQVNLESGFNPKAVSPAGAEGMYQFLPGTYTSEGGKAGTEFDAAAETAVYITFMKSLLKWSGGDVRKALAAYNAGQGNWQAGQGYADEILKASSQSNSLTVGTTGASGGGQDASLTSIISDAGNAVSEFSTIANVASDLLKPSFWLRVGAFFGGMFLLGMGLYALIKTLDPDIHMPTPAPVPVP